MPDAVLEELVPPPFAAWDGARQGQLTEHDVIEAARRIVQSLTRVLPTVTSDERILRAIAYANAHLDRALTLEEVSG